LDWTVRTRDGGTGDCLDVPESATICKARLNGQLSLKSRPGGTNLEGMRFLRDTPKLGCPGPGSELSAGTRHSTPCLGALHVRHWMIITGFVLLNLTVLRFFAVCQLFNVGVSILVGYGCGVMPFSVLHPVELVCPAGSHPCCLGGVAFTTLGVLPEIQHPFGEWDSVVFVVG